MLSRGSTERRQIFRSAATALSEQGDSHLVRLILALCDVYKGSSYTCEQLVHCMYVHAHMHIQHMLSTADSQLL